MSKALVVIVGRTNVGKSTLFNRIIGKKLSIVADEDGITRDALLSSSSWNGKDFFVMDTGGYEKNSKKEDIIKKVVEKTFHYIKKSDAIIVVVDVFDGILPDDIEIANILKKTKKPIFLAVNKCDSIGDPPSNFYEFYELFQNNIFPVSAIHGHGIGDLLDKLIFSFKKTELKDEIDIFARVAVVGKPNVGKSSLINSLVGEKRLIVSNKAGTTRDAVDVIIKKDKKKYIFVDTAGMRKKNTITEKIEKYSYFRALMAIERADVCILLIDATKGPVEQDLKIAGYIHKNGKASIIAVNKWDLIEKNNNSISDYIKKLKNYFNFMSYLTCIFISAKTGKRVFDLFYKIDEVYFESKKRISTGMLNELLSYSISKVPTPSIKGKKLKIYYITQAKTNPPTFIIFLNNKKLLHFSYVRYLENEIRKEFNFIGNPIRFIFREKNIKNLE